MKKIFIKGAGILYSEIILTALQEYRVLCNGNGNYARADAANRLISAIEFDHSVANTEELELK